VYSSADKKNQAKQEDGYFAHTIVCVELSNKKVLIWFGKDKRGKDNHRKKR
jgi:hypothetical protein